jgi:hypothetical protein
VLLASLGHSRALAFDIEVLGSAIISGPARRMRFNDERLRETQGAQGRQY